VIVNWHYILICVSEFDGRVRCSTEKSFEPKIKLINWNF
jgi:hypothetical protein